MAGRLKPTAGEAFRAEVTARWELTAPELLILDGTCAAVDRIDALEALVDRDGLMVPGSAGQPAWSTSYAYRTRRAARWPA
jgi:hypothetical protein